jgi:hypothetical protein
MANAPPEVYSLSLLPQGLFPSRRQAETQEDSSTQASEISQPEDLDSYSIEFESSWDDGNPVIWEESEQPSANAEATAVDDSWDNGYPVSWI